MKLSSDQQRNALMVPDAAAALKRFYFLMRETIRMQAGWMPGTAHWETKLLYPESIWMLELAAWQLRERVLDLRYPERRIEPDADAPLLDFWRTLGDAPSAEAFAAGFHGPLLDALRGAIAAYLSATDPLDDAPTVRILRHALDDIQTIQNRYNRSAETPLNPVAMSWHTAAAAAVAQMPEGWWNPAINTGFIFCERLLNPLKQPLAIARKGARDKRFKRALFSWPDSLDPSRGAGTGFELQVRQAQAHLNEVWAAEMAAACIYDLMDEAPAEFLHDAARWCFDEIRHCRMGYTRFSDWGFQKSEMPMGSYSYDLGAELSPVERLGVIFYFETTYIHTKSDRTKSFAEFGDRTSSHDMDFDWADELIHTYYGKRWLEFFLEKEGGVRKPATVKAAALQAVENIRSRATEQDRQQTEQIYRETMERAKELAYAS